MMLKWVNGAAACGLLAVCAAAVWAYRVAGSVADLEPAPQVAYTRLDGTPASSAQWAGKVVLVNFWATSCVTCVQEMPAIVATHERFQSRGYDTVAIAMHYDPPALVVRFAESRKLPFQVAIDHSGSLAKSFGEVAVTPTSLLINRHGQIVQRYVGRPDFDALHATVEKLLAER
jgi:peroxiredoxin